MDSKSRINMLTRVAEYYSAVLARHGEQARGVDWNSEESQRLRFEQLSRIITMEDGFSINDLGCGYGALYDFLNTRYTDFSYCGFDISESMIEAGSRRLEHCTNARFELASAPSHVSDYGIASGIFNVKLEHSDSQWYDYIVQTLDALNVTSRCGFSFNCLTSYSDAEKMKEYLFYADPCVLFDHCKKRYARNVSLLHDYGLFEFTILVRKIL